MITLIANSEFLLKQGLGATARGYKCAFGRGGMIAAELKREGDGASPIGKWPLRRVFYRADRIEKPITGVLTESICEDDGWCDDPAHKAYNQLVKLPFSASHEKMWRDDHVYDVVVELGHNDAPPVPGLGSAIFMHVAKPDYSPTQGCIALAVEDLLAVLKDCETGSILEIRT